MQIKVTPFSCRRDAFTICGTEYRPAGTNLPVAIVSHGFMANQNSVRRYARYFAQWGYSAYCFDFCGGGLLGKSDGHTTDMTVFTEQADLEHVIGYARSLSYTDSTRLVLMGCSQGGFVSALTAAKLSAQVEKLILFYPALCIPDDARAGRMLLAKFDPDNIPAEFSCGPMRLGRAYAASVLRMNPFEAIAAYPGPVLIVHGIADAIVDLKYAVRAAAAYENRRAGRCVLVSLKRAGHGFHRREDVQALSHVQQFLIGNRVRRGPAL